MSGYSEKIHKGRLTTSQKNAHKKQWYKDKADEICASHKELSSPHLGGVSELKRMKVNYDLFNNVCDVKELEYVCKPFGEDSGELPANMVNRDISSGKIKALLGMEMKRPFSWKVSAINPEATTRKEAEQFSRILKHVQSSIVGPIRQEIETKAMEEQKGKELSEKEKEVLSKKIEEQVSAQTPPEVEKYMQREHQDPAEVMCHQLLEYLLEKLEVREKMNIAFKHLSLSAKEVVYVGIHNEELVLWNVDSMKVNARLSSISGFIEDAESLSVEYDMTFSEIVTNFNEDLTDKQIDEISEKFSDRANVNERESDYFDLAEDQEFFEENSRDMTNKMTVTHCLWRSLRKIAILTYKGVTGKEEKMLVHESYVIEESIGDIKIDYKWLPESYETWVIGDMHIRCRPVQGQFRDVYDLSTSKFPYYGVFIDDMNSKATAPMDRLKQYQYYYNIIMYRVELLIASDKGKKVLMNIGSVPDSMGIDIDKFKYFFESSPFMWVNPNEEGAGYADTNSAAKVIDLSLASDIAKYIDFAEYLRRQAGSAIGVTDAVEGQSPANESVGNNRQNLVQTSHILEPYFNMHNIFKKNVLEAIINTARVAFSGENSYKLSYVVDGVTSKVLQLDMNLVNTSRYGLFITDSTKAEEALQTIKQLSHAAMQNQKAELSDVMALLRQEGVVEAEEVLRVAENRKLMEARQAEKARGEQQQEYEKLVQQGKQQEFENEKEIVILKEEERRKTVVVQASITGMSYNPDADADKDGVNDFQELAMHGVDAQIKREELALKREELGHKKVSDQKDRELKEKEIREKAISHKKPSL